MDYLPIRISSLRGDQKVGFDAYIKINDKMILYIRRGDSFEGERLVRLKSKKLKKMFIQPEQEPSYLGYLQTNIDMAYDANSGKSLENRVEVIQGIQQLKAEEVMDNPGDEMIYSDAKLSAEKFARFMATESQGLGPLLNIENVDQNLAHHGVTVSAMAVALAQKLGQTDIKKNQLLTLGCLIHDIGHVESGVAINLPINDLSPEDKKKYYAHPLDGLEKVSGQKHYDQTVLKIILEHEEFIDGKGFPKNLKERDIDPQSMIAATCNALDRLITFEGTPRKDAQRTLMMRTVGRYPLQHIQLLGDILQSTKAS